jgi:hypothetical protein
MNSRRLLLTAAILMLGLGLAADSRADISDASVLFLRIAPGSRPAGMGEAYVAIADDATATHWNPAGLGSAPLSDTWIEPKVPAEYRPLKAIAPVNRGGGKGYRAYDIWGLTPKGLVRYDNRKWYSEEVVSTKTDETLAKKVRAYFAVSDDQRLEGIIDRVAAVNNEGTLEELQQLRDQVLAVAPADHQDLSQVTADLDSLVVLWRECRVQWPKVREAQSLLKEGLKDSVMSNDELTRISLALERSRNRWLPEEIRIPYTALFTGEPSLIASSGKILLVGCSDGLARFNGSNWSMFSAADGLPSCHITALRSVGRLAIVGTDSGLVMFNGLTLEPLTTEDGFVPQGTIEAVGGSSMSMIVAVIAGDLYQYDGRRWKSTTAYAAVADDTPERIAEKFSLSGSPVERQLYLEKYRRVFQSVDTIAAAVPSEGDSASAGDSSSSNSETSGVPGYDSPITPGEIVEIPMISRVKGTVNDIHVDRLNRIWLATDYGVFWMDDKGWHAPGYVSHIVAEGETIDQIVAMRGLVLEDEIAQYRDLLADLNDIGDANPLKTGDAILVYSTPAAVSVNSISSDGDKLMVATKSGVIEYDGSRWARADMRTGRDNVIAVSSFGEDMWVATDSKIVVGADGRPDISLTHVPWLPDLASDMYYEFIAGTVPVSGVGTFGLSLTYLTYGSITRTGSSSSAEEGTFDAYDLAVAGSYGTSLTSKLKAGLSAKVILSRLADAGAGAELGSGTSTGFAVDFGLLYHMTPRLNWGLAVTNIGPSMKYIDAAQSDPLPCNLAFGLAYKLIQSEYSKILVTLETNKQLVGLNDGLSKELQELVLNGGLEFSYINLLAARGGYVWDQEGDVKVFTLGFGLRPIDLLQADFSYIPSQGSTPLSNTLRFSLRLML